MTLDATTVGAAIGFTGAILGAVISASVAVWTQRSNAGRQDQQVRKIVLALYRNAFRQLDGTMRLGYLDQPGRFTNVLEMVINRVSKDDIATVFTAEQTGLILTSIPSLLDGVHGCMEAYALFEQSAGGSELDDFSRAQYAESVRQAAGAALAISAVVLQSLGDTTMKPYPPNARRILQLMDAENKKQREEEQRDKETT